MVCDNKQQKTLHFGYILLSSEDLVPSAVEKLNGKRFVGRDIKAQPFRSNVALETANTGVIHVGFRGLKAEIPLITEEVLRSYLESFGELDQIVIRNLLYTKEKYVGLKSACAMNSSLPAKPLYVAGSRLAYLL
eukprot:gene11172-7947_t